MFGPRRGTWCITVETLVSRVVTFKRSLTETTQVVESPSSTKAAFSFDSLRYPITFETGSLDGNISALVRSSVTDIRINWSGFIVKSRRLARILLSI